MRESDFSGTVILLGGGFWQKEIGTVSDAFSTCFIVYSLGGYFCCFNQKLKKPFYNIPDNEGSSTRVSA